MISYAIVSEGGALGTVRYTLFAEHQGRRSKIFEGTGGDDVGLIRHGPDLIVLRFCGGTIDHLTSIHDDELGRRVFVQPIIYCPRD